MYHAEKVINGVLCHRSIPNGEWKPYTPEQLTTRLITAREERDNKQRFLEAAYNEVLEIKKLFQELKTLSI